MAKVQWVGESGTTIPELGRALNKNDVVEVPDDRYGGYIPQDCDQCGKKDGHPKGSHRSPDHPWKAIEAPKKTKKAEE